MRFLVERLFVITLLLVVAGCTSTKIVRLYNSGEFESVASNRGYSSLRSGELFIVCESLAKMQNFDEFFKCHQALTIMVENAGGFLDLPYYSPFVYGPSNIRNKPWSSYGLLMLKADVYFKLGDYEKAVTHASQAYQLAKDNVFMSVSEQKHKFTMAIGDAMVTAMTFGLSDTLSEDLEKKTQGQQVLALEILMLSYASLDMREKAEEYVEIVKAMKWGFGPVAYDNKTKQHMALSRYYYMTEQYQLSLEAISSKRLTAWEEAFVKLNYINPAQLLVGPMHTNSFSLADILYIHSLEPKFILARSYLETGNLEEAAKIYDNLLDENRFTGLQGPYFSALFDMGRIAESRGQNENALGFYQHAIDVMESQRATIKSDGLKINFVNNKNDVYEKAVSLLINDRRFSEAFEYAERAKARALVDMLSSKPEFRAAGVSGNNLLANLENSELEIRRSDSNIRAKKRSALMEGYKKIQQEAPELASLVTVSVPALKDVQSRLAPDEVILEYFGSKENFYAFAINSAGINAVKLDGNGLESEIRSFREAVQDPDSSDFYPISKSLYLRLVTPLLRDIKSGKRLTVVPQGVLHYLPFAALNSGDDYLIDQFKLRILPSSSVLRFIDKGSTASRTALVLGNPDLGDPDLDLPGAQDEAIAISKQIEDVQLLLRGDATETVVKEHGQSFRFLHFASHGTFYQDKPLSSGLLLSEDASNDGNLSVGELYDLKLSADLVTLSACETALGTVSNGDDVVGFTRGFLFAGASSIVSSLWKVDDQATNSLMQSFYTNLKNKDKQTALMNAQIELKSGKFSHPYFWAAFQLTGAI